MFYSRIQDTDADLIGIVDGREYEWHDDVC